MNTIRGYQVYYNDYLIGTYTSMATATKIAIHELEQMDVSETTISYFEEECKHYLPVLLSAEYEEDDNKLMVIPIEITVG